jgi:threonine synthase
MKPTFSLGESDTPLLKLPRLKQILNWEGEIWGKCEFLNPTGSFKDRGSVAEVGQALSQNKQGVVCASTGNMAASLAAYAAKTRLKCVVFIPANTPTNKLQQAVACGATLKKIDGNYDTCVQQAIDYAEANNYLLCGDYELRRRGQSTIGVELAKSEVNIGAFIAPLGNGTLACAISEGLSSYGLYPKLIGIQGENASPITQAFVTRNKIIKLENPQTIASAMNVGSPLDGDLTLTWINKTNGQIYAATDQDILDSQKLLAATEGLYVESAAAATISALKQYPNKNENIVLIFRTFAPLAQITSI